jgi:signal peptidase
VNTSATTDVPTKEAPASPSTPSVIVRALGLGASAALLLATLLIAFFVVALPALVGGQALTVLTNSMSPSMPPGTLVVVRPTPFDEIAPGDIITYQIRSGSPEVVTHRVQQRLVASDGTVSFITRGDNNNTADAEPVHEVQVRGTAWYSVPLLGWANNVLTGQTRAIVVPLLALACFVYAAFAFVSGALSRRRSRRARAAERATDAAGVPAADDTVADATAATSTSTATTDLVASAPTRASLRRDAR